MENVTYIIPILKIDNTVEEYLVNAIKSVTSLEFTEGDKLLFVGKKEELEKTDKAIRGITIKQEIIHVENNETDFFTQINKAVMNCITPYFSILEIDDAYCNNWNLSAQQYATNGASVILPINEYYEGKYYDGEGNMFSFGNEIAWSSSYANEQRGLGFIDIDCLKTFADFNCTGAFFKTEDFISLGGLKPSLKIAAWYEFLLRAAYNNGKSIYVVPKIGYKHTFGRDGSFMVEHKNISEDEGKWYYTTALQEYFFKEDRNKKFIKDGGED